MAAPSDAPSRASERAPSVLAIIVATNGERWLPAVLKGLKAQNHRPLEILAIDNASDDTSRALLEKAFGVKRVVGLDRRVGYGRAVAAGVKVAAERALPVDVLLLLHDDAALEPGALESMLEALADDAVGVVGAKIVEWEDPQLLQEVGGTTDRYGRIVSRVERGELDQGQYDGVHEVLYASSAAMLVSADVVERVGLFDPRYVALRDDFDFCWRARLAGFRVVVAAGAKVRHAAAAYRQLRLGPARGRVRYFGDRNMIATLIKNYGLPRLLLTLPVTITVSILNTVFFLLTGRRRAALQSLEALQWNLTHLPSTLRARLRAQSRREVPDREITRLMVRGFPKLRSQLQRVVERVVGEVEEAEEPPEERPRLLERLAARRVVLLWIALGVAYVVGARSLLRSGPLAGADMAPFAGAGDLFEELLSGWRSAGTGGAAPATPGLALLGILTYVCFGSAWLAQRVLVLGLPLAGVAFTWRLARLAGLDAAPSRAAAIAYGLSPLALGVLGAGRLTDLVLVAAAPALVTPLLRSGGFLPHVGAARWRSLAAGTAGLAAGASLSPWALAFTLGAGALLAVGTLTVARAPVALAVLRRSAAMTLGAAALLLPWTVELFREGSPVGLGGTSRGETMADLLGLTAGGHEPVPAALSYGLALTAVVGILLAVRARASLGRALVVAGSLSLLVAWAVARGVPWLAPRSGGPLILAAVAAALLAGIALEGFRPTLADRDFGWRHIALVAVSVVIVVQLGAGSLWLARGDRPGLVPVGQLAPAFLAAEERTAGDFRVLWVSGGPRRVDAELTPPEGTTMLTYADRRAGAGADALAATLSGMVAGATQTGGRALATFGVRYVIARPGTNAALLDALASQTSLTFVQRFRGATIFRNESAIPVAASVGAPGWARASGEGLEATAGTESDPRAGPGFRRLAAGAFAGRTAKGARLLVLAQDDGDWSAETPRSRLERQRSFGWATAFRISGSHAVSVRWGGQTWHRAALAAELALVLVFAAAWSRAAARERGER